MRPFFLLCSLAIALSPIFSEPRRSLWDHHPTRKTSTWRHVARVTTTTTTPAPTPDTRAQISNTRETRVRHGTGKTRDHRIGWSVSPERCQISPEARSYGDFDSYYIDYVSDLLVQDKTLLAPIVFEGAMVSRTNTFKNLYFVSFKVFRVLKGKVHKQLQGHVRLLFRTERRRSGE